MAGRLTLEAVDAAQALLDGYDRTSGRWSFAMAGEFWDVVAEAHRRGLTGEGMRVAIVDTAFDLSIDRLAEAADGAARKRARPGEPTTHGTAVALLILAVAPNVKLDLYEATMDGELDGFAIGAALRRIAASEADVLCLSLGAGVDRAAARIPIEDRLRALAAEQDAEDLLKILDVLFENDGAKQIEVDCPLRPCLCAELQAAARPGRAMFAAVGNGLSEVFCPARARCVVSVGFMREDRTVNPQGGESALAAPPDFAQSIWSDHTIRQPSGVLGSSFAAPLAAGVAALGIDAAGLDAMIASQRLAGVAGVLLDIMYKERGLPAPVEKRMVGLYAKAISIFPHKELLRTSDHWCVGCALLGARTYTNAGLAIFLTGHHGGHLRTAESLLRTARHLVPQDPHAAANLGKVLCRRGQLSFDEAVACGREALAHYDAAIARRPGYKGYDAMREEAAALARR